MVGLKSSDLLAPRGVKGAALSCGVWGSAPQNKQNAPHLSERGGMFVVSKQLPTASFVVKMRALDKKARFVLYPTRPKPRTIEISGEDRV